MTGRRSQSKGGRGERELVELAKSAGFHHARRNFASGAVGGGDVTGITGLHVEVKRTERFRLWDAWAQATGDCPSGFDPVVFTRRNGSAWLAVVDADVFLNTWARGLL